MKKCILFLVLNIALSAHAENSIRRGYFISGFDKVRNSNITTRASVEINPLNNSARLYIDREAMEGSVTDGVASAYDTTPITYFYYEIILNPRLDSEGQVIFNTLAEMNKILPGSGNETLVGYNDVKCPKGANAILVSYKGNGTSKKDCLYLESSKPVSQ